MELASGSGGSLFLTGVIAFVDVWSFNRTENYSKMFSQQLLNLGAKVLKTFNKQVTHVVFKDGSQSTWDKAVKSKVKLVSVLWVEKCRETAGHVEESVYPAINTNVCLPQLTKKKRKCMQPKDYVEKTPENDRRLARKFDKMCKDLDVRKASADIPVFSFEDDEIILYSPKALVADRCNAMEKRIQEMKNKRENLSPTASQMSHTFDFSSLKPSLGNSPSLMTEPTHENDTSSLNTSYDELFESVLKGGSVPSTPSNDQIHVVKEVPVCSIFSKSDLSPRKTKEVKSSPDRVKRQSRTQAKCLKSNRFKLTNENVSASFFTMNETPVVDFTSMANKAGSKLSLDDVERETTNFAVQFSHEDQPSNKIENDVPSTTDNDSGSDAFSETPPDKDRISGLDYSSMANRLIALCKEKEQSKKTGQCSLKSDNPINSAKSKAVKVEAKSHASSGNTHSDDAFSSFEDFFTSSDLNNYQSKLGRFSLTVEPRRSPSPPTLTSNSKNFHKRRRSVGVALQEKCTVKKRKTIHSVTPSVSSPLESSVSYKNHTSSRKSVASTRKESPVASRSETSICLEKSEVAGNDDKIQTFSRATGFQANGLKNTVTAATCNKMQDVAGDQETLHLRDDIQHGKQTKLSLPSVESKTSASDAIGGLSEMFNEQRNKCTEESRKTEKSRKVTRSLVMTSMPSEKQITIIQVVKKLGGFVFSDEVCETTTHVIAGCARRTLNIILGIARGCWILSYDWVLWSLERGHWISEEPYELSDHFPGASICRLQRHLSAGEFHQDLFSSMPAIFISQNSQPPCDKLSDVVQLCGGKVCKTLRPAKICIGSLTGKKPTDLDCVSEKWLLDSITQHKILPLQSYLMEQ
ncbi:microcephalin isoform X2 [Rhinoderma darwinii]|uniref:microcephalin isoform X2 n=1 Tax=Rhinoderma darwinii TaxID=43563 RepID=UPI003F66AF36